MELKDDQFLGSSVQIFTPAGQMIYIDKLTENKKQIVLQEVPAGLFIVKIQHDKASTAKEIFITSSH
ncbi:MAG: T9SS type A sorting domain-containing protein [Chitinophagales bacterium]|nr:T9SS type A sorting domain-containing protein [Chitinophagales bacterium]